MPADCLRFESAMGEHIGEVPIIVFGVRKVVGALNRQGWNVKGHIDPRW